MKKPKKKSNTNKCPCCKASLTMLWSGVKCKKCGYWFCY